MLCRSFPAMLLLCAAPALVAPRANNNETLHFDECSLGVWKEMA
jgi:hypothetical protein